MTPGQQTTHNAGSEEPDTSVSPDTVDGPRIECEVVERVHAAMHTAGIPPVRRIRIHGGREALSDLTVVLRVEPGMAGTWRTRIAAVPADSTYNISPGSSGIDTLVLDPEAVWDRTERVDAEIVATVQSRDGETLATWRGTVAILPFQEWPGTRLFPELIAAFVMPNAVSVGALLKAIARQLATATADPAIDGYSRRDPSRARQVAAALYACLQQQRIDYVSPPASFEREGQRVRTPDEVQRDGIGTCLDLAVLAGSVLEQAGLRPLVIFTEGHATVATWLHPHGFQEPVVSDPVRLRKRIDLGEIVAFDVTEVTRADNATDFDSACVMARRALEDSKNYVCAVDIRVARRLADVRPLPVRTSDATGTGSSWTIPEGMAPSRAQATPEPEPAADPPIDQTPATSPPLPTTRLERVRTKLLDLSLHNRLLNLRPTRKTLALQQPLAGGSIEDALASGASLRIEPCLAMPDSEPNLDPVEQVAAKLRAQLREHSLHAALTDQELQRRLVDIARGARAAQEESGANTLFLSIGMLHWFESEASSQLRMAPILLLPLELERASPRSPFTVRLADDEPRLNESLVAKLQSDFGLRVLGESGLSPDALPTDDRGVDVDAILQAFRKAVRDVDRWEVVDETWIALFSFTKFLMWNDLSQSADILLRHPLLQHFLGAAEDDTNGTRLQHESTDIDPELVDHLPPTDLLCPLDADSSQTSAILAAAGFGGESSSTANGPRSPRSFVLEGPPGTGKSQTITNLIAHALGTGKRVLFVAEKRAALEVVQSRLEQVGIGEFCLALHSNKASKRRVIEALGRPLEISDRQPEPGSWRQRAEEFERVRRTLNDWVEAMHEIRASGFSVFQATSRAIELGDGATVRLGLEFADAADPVGGIDEARYRAMGEAVERLANATRAVGSPPDHVFRAVRREQWDPSLTDPCRRKLQAVLKRIGPARNTRAELAEALYFPSGDPSRRTLRLERDLLSWLSDAEPAPARLATAPDLPGRRSFLEDVLDRVRDRDEATLVASAVWTPEAATLGTAAISNLADTFRTGAQTAWVLRVFKLWNARKQVAGLRHDGRCPPPERAAEDLALLLRQLRAEEAVIEVSAETSDLVGSAWREGHPDPEHIERLLVQAENLRALAFESTPSADPAASLTRLEAHARLVEHADDMLAEGRPVGDAIRAARRASTQLDDAWMEVRALLELDTEELSELEEERAPFHAQLEELVTAWVAELPRLRDWCHFLRAGTEANEYGLSALVAAHRGGGLSTASLAEGFERSFLQEWLFAATSGDPCLRNFHGLDHEHRIERFRGLDLELLRMTTEVVRARLMARVPDNAHSGGSLDVGEVGVLLRELKKQRRHLPVRRLFERIPNLLPRIAPCMLMSPLSVAQYLSPDSEPFDLVLFDEASQVRLWDAIGSIARARTVVVVGDSRQLPPTDFFNAIEDAEDEQVGDIDDYEDLESLLDECVAAGMPRMYLRWHYRSRHESLITFSNHHYYDNRLLTFPSPDAEHPHMGVRFMYVQDGIYDRGRSQTNPVEAQRLVEEIVRRLTNPEERRRSLGVVTFSVAQQNLVQDLLDAARRQHPEIEPYFGSEVEEPVFIKNLESVQGDERDVILFSIGYGPDAQGRVHMVFGPLNRSGGERRLNVAVTRAREELVVLSSILPDQIDLTRTRSVGAQHLKSFLDYAARGVRALAEAIVVDETADFDSPFEREVCRALEGAGHTVHRQVGCSGYRIDLAIVDPERPGRYLLGIECDGASYHSAATARDRDRLRASVLARLGWRLHRVWSTDWWQFPRGELERIEAALAAARAENPIPAPRPLEDETLPPPRLQSWETDGGALSDPASCAEPEPPPFAAAPTTSATPPPPQPFVEPPARPTLGAAESIHDADEAPRLAQAIDEILADEAPIVRERLLRRLAVRYEISRMTPKVRERCNEALAHALQDGRAVADPDEGEDVLWSSNQDPDKARSWRPADTSRQALRDPASDVPLTELAACATALVTRAVAMQIDDLIRSVARAFGASRVGSATRRRIESAIDLAARRGDIERSAATVKSR